MAVKIHPLMRLLSWFVLYSIITAVPPVFLSGMLLVIGFLNPALMNYATFAVFVVVIVLILIGVVSLLPFAHVAYMRRVGTNPVVARQRMEEMEREGNEKDNERKAFGLLIGLGGLAFIVPISPIPICGSILSTWARSIVAIFTFDLTLLGLFIAVYVSRLRKYVQST